MITLNLIPDVKREFIAAQKMRVKVISSAILLSIVALGLTVLAALWVYAAQNLQKSLATSAIKSNVAKLEDVKDLGKYLTVQNQLANLSALHDGKNDFSRLLDYLPKLNPATPNNVLISSLSIDDTVKTMLLTGNTKNYTALVTFKDTLTNASLTYSSGNGTAAAQQTTKLFSSVEVTSSGAGKDVLGNPVVSFAITVVYDTHAFLNSSQSLVLTIPNTETTPSAQDAPNIFGGTQ